jgi:predicted phage-related endonuclease
MLTNEQRARRAGKVTASFIPSLMAGDERRMLSEWQRLVGHPDFTEEDLSANWAVAFGCFIEPVALDWHERKTGHALTLRGDWVQHSDHPWLGATLDAWREHDSSVIDCKAPGAYRNLDEVRSYYCSQVIVQRACLNADRAALLIVHGGAEPVEYEATWPESYEAEVWQRIHWFWGRVETLQPPCAIPAVKGPVPAIRTVDMQGNNSWASAAGEWLGHKAAAGRFNDSVKIIKSLLEPDVMKAFGHGISATRSRAGAVSIKEL